MSPTRCSPGTGGRWKVRVSLASSEFTSQPDPARARLLLAAYRLIIAKLGRKARQEQAEGSEVDGQDGLITMREAVDEGRRLQRAHP